IGANPLECAVGGLYHDIGKLLKPEFFAENQASTNPHDDQNPSMSALIIKSHVREGVDLARKYKMPPVVTDAILQHHGNSVISYFYYKALNLVGANASKDELMQAMRNCGIEEGDFRHEGKKPQTPETAILMLADSCEAASRSLKRVTPHSIEELVDKIFKAKMSDRQLDESSITLKQLAKVRESIIFTLKNMLHSRVEYNTPPAALSGAKSGEPENK
ncbi:MAG: HD domain-containing protein, partial [Opitutales bacterium]|nr:HD domain-containing protein [Opitutales bacterium]